VPAVEITAPYRLVGAAQIDLLCARARVDTNPSSDSKITSGYGS
jgi:hypothetical protein